MSGLFFNAAFALYAVGLFHSVAAYSLKKDSVFRIAIAAHAVGFLLHGLYLVALGAELRHFPLTSLREAAAFFAWAVSLFFLLAYWRYGLRAMGLFALPLVTFLMVGTVFLKSFPAPDILRSYWVYLHSASLLLAYGMFFVTSVSSLLYLLQERDIKSRRPQLLQDRLPALLTMDQAFEKFLLGGFIFMTVGLSAGIIWAEKEWTLGWKDDPKVIAAFVTWLIYLTLIFVRFSMGWRGKRTALISLLGFLSVLFTFVAQVFFGSLHTFG